MLPSQVFHRSSTDGSGLLGYNFQIAFLDEFRFMALYYDNSPNDPELFVFNTLIPQDHPRNLRRFGLPQGLQECEVRISLDHDRSSGAVNRDGPLIVDPTQTVSVVDLRSRLGEQRGFLILRT